MKLLTFRREGVTRVGVLKPDAESEVVELSEHVDMLSLIDAGKNGMAEARSAITSVTTRTHRLQDVDVLAPLALPRGNVIAIGRNYQAHAQESARAEGKPVDPPTVFTKAITTVAGPYDDVVIDASVSTQVDWEVELGVVIGRRGRNIARKDAHGYIFGYVALNDVSARDIQFGWGGQFFKGKSLDGYCPIGPWIVTPDEIPDPQSLRLKLRVNGVEKQNGSTRDMIYPIDALIEWVSKGMTIPAGSLMATGTPDGVGFYRTPPEFLKPGDVMETEVERIGMLRNRLVAAAP